MVDRQDITEQCMNHDSKAMDLEFCFEDPPLLGFLFPGESSTDLSGMKDNSSEINMTDENKQQSSPMNLSLFGGEDVEKESQHQSKEIKKRTHKNPIKFSIYYEDQSESVPRRAIKHRRKRGQANSYPTKNFLPNFKGPHIQFLYNYFDSEEYVNSFEIVKIIREKNGISMNDYQNLYSQPSFEQAWKVFFKTRVLYRELMLSRSSLKARRIHIKKLHVFEEAFLSKQFNKIN